jgi:hypothetical protein
MSRGMVALLPRLAPIVARLSSPHDGERLACVTAIERLLVGQRLDFNDFASWLASPPAIANGPRHSAKHGPTRMAVRDGLLHDLQAVIESTAATEREAEIALSLLQQARSLGGLTGKQIALAEMIIGQVRDRAGGGK